MPNLVLARHGATRWNDQNIFTGWGNTTLSVAGEEQARALGGFLARENFQFDLCHASRLSRSEETLQLLLQAMGTTNTPVERFWRLNERHYGALQGVSRLDVVKRYGNAAVTAWRRSYQSRPPALDALDPRWIEQCQQYSELPRDLLPRSESLEDGVLRTSIYWHECLTPQLLAGRRVLIVGHTSSIRSLVRVLEGLSDDEAAKFRIPAAIPLVYELDSNLTLLSKHWFYGSLDNRLRVLRSRIKPRAISWI